MDQDIVVGDGLVEVKLSDRHVVKIKELDGWEQRQADRLCGQDIGLLPSTRAACAVREIDGEKVSLPQNELEVRAFVSRLSGRESDKLMIAYQQNFGDEAVQAAVKN